MNSYIDGYMDALKSKNLSENTVSSYLSDLRRFYEYCEDKKIRSFREMTSSFVNGYVSSLLDAGRKPASVNRTISSLKSYFSFIKENKFHTSDPTKKLKTVAAVYKNPEYLSEKEITNLCDFGRFYTPKEYRDTLMICFCVYSGLSVSEVCSLNVSDVNLNVGTVKITSGKHSRIVVLSDIAINRVEHYINTLRPALIQRDSDETALFVSVDKKAITRQGFWKNLKGRCKRLKIKKKITPVSLKYSFMVRKIEHGETIENVMTKMGYLDRDSFRKCSNMLKEKYQKAERKNKRGK